MEHIKNGKQKLIRTLEQTSVFFAEAQACLNYMQEQTSLVHLFFKKYLVVQTL